MCPKPQLIEQTAKRWKAIQLVGFGVAIPGFLCLSAGVIGKPGLFWPGLCVFGLGSTITFVGWAIGWWQHG